MINFPKGISVSNFQSFTVSFDCQTNPPLNELAKIALSEKQIRSSTPEVGNIVGFHASHGSVEKNVMLPS